MANRRDALEADFQEVYGLDLSRMGQSFSARHAAALYSQLPPGCRVRSPEGPRDPWGPTEYLLSEIEYLLHILCYRGTEDARARINAPVRIESPVESMRRAASDAQADPGEVAAALGIDLDRL